MPLLQSDRNFISERLVLLIKALDLLFGVVPIQLMQIKCCHLPDHTGGQVTLKWNPALILFEQNITLLGWNWSAANNSLAKLPKGHFSFCG